MKKVILTLLFVMVALAATFAQAYIGATKKEILNTIKPDAKKIERPEKSNDGTYTIGVHFEEGYGVFSFTKDDVCNYFMIGGKYTLDDFNSLCDNFNKKFKKLENTSQIIWVDYDPKFAEYVYYWVLINYKQELMYLVTIKQSDFELYEKALIKTFLK